MLLKNNLQVVYLLDRFPFLNSLICKHFVSYLPKLYKLTQHLIVFIIYAEYP